MIRIHIAGDFTAENRTSKLLDGGRFSDLLSDIEPIIKSADFSVVNLESPVVEGNAPKLEKNGPNLKCSAKAVDALKWCGFQMAALANNHIYDYGEEGLWQTVETLTSRGLDYVGVGKTPKDASTISYKQIKNKTVAFINACEHEFSIVTDIHSGANPLNPIQQFYAIKEAKASADYVVVIIHGGSEMYKLPSPRMQEIYRFFIDAGADAVVNHHQHCYSGYEIYRGKPIVYGLGNFCFDDPDSIDGIWNYGYMLELQLEDDNIGLKLYPYKQCGEKVGVQLLADRDAFDEDINRLNSIIADSQKFRQAFADYAATQRRGRLMAFEPYGWRILKALYWRGFLPSFLSKKKCLQMENMIGCESHRDILLSALKR